MTAVTILSDFGAQENKTCHCFYFFPPVFHEGMGQWPIFYMHYLCFFIYFYLFLTVLGIRCCVQVFSCCGDQGLLSSWTVWASHCNGFYCGGAQALGHRAHGLSGCGPRALERSLSSCGAWGLVALRHVGSPQIRAWTCISCLAGRFFTAEPPGRSFLSI